MGKKYLDTKEGSLEQSVLGVWQTAIEEGETRVDGRTKAYKEHRAKLEAARLRREKLVGGQKKLDKDKDGDIDGKDFAMLRKSKNKDKKEEVVKEGTWALPDTPKLKAGLKKLMMKKIPLGKDGDDAIDKIGGYIGDDELYDDLYTASKKNGPKGDARQIIRGWMDRNFVDSWEKYRIETITILNRIDQKIQERKNG